MCLKSTLGIDLISATLPNRDNDDIQGDVILELTNEDNLYVQAIRKQETLQEHANNISQHSIDQPRTSLT